MLSCTVLFARLRVCAELETKSPAGSPSARARRAGAASAGAEYHDLPGASPTKGSGHGQGHGQTAGGGAGVGAGTE